MMSGSQSIELDFLRNIFLLRWGCSDDNGVEYVCNMSGYISAKVGTFIKNAQYVRLTASLSSVWSKLDTCNRIYRVLLAGNQT